MDTTTIEDIEALNRRVTLELDTHRKQMQLKREQALADGTEKLPEPKVVDLSWQKPYQLVEVGQHNFAYQLREPGEEEAQHSLCPTCFNRGKKSVMMLAANPPARLGCKTCGTQVFISTHLDVAEEMKPKREAALKALAEKTEQEAAAVPVTS